MTRANDLDPAFRHIRLELARERANPEGAPGDGYDLLAPLDGDGRLDPGKWKVHQMLCRVRRFRRSEEDRVGRLRRKPGGSWYFDFAEGKADDEPGYRLGAERFVPGEYVSIRGAGKMHTYRVTRVSAP
ncbi:MAG: hypothetical protein AB7I79_02725 [Rhizobiaceae bacterium]